MTSPVFRLLTSDATVSAIVGTRVYRSGRAPQGVVRPYVTWSTVGGHPEVYVAQRPSVEQGLTQIDCWSESEAECAALAASVVNALETSGYQNGGAMDDFEEDTGLYRMTVQFYFWNRRPS